MKIVNILFATITLLATWSLSVMAQPIQQPYTFSSMGVELKGTLWLPGTAGSYPAVICLHGSGKIDRNGFYIKGFAEYFSKRGIAVLAFDKRGVGESGGEYPGSYGGSMVQYAADAIAALHTLNKLPEIDGRQIGLFGVSQGGYIIPLAAAMDKKNVAFTIIVSGPIVSIGKENLFSDLTGNAQGSPTGISAEEIRTRLAEYDPKGYNPYPFVEEMFKPGLWVWGANDRSVPPVESLENLKKIKKRWDRKFTWKVFENADHGLKYSPTGNRWETPSSAPLIDGYYETMEQWLIEIGVIKN